MTDDGDGDRVGVIAGMIMGGWGVELVLFLCHLFQLGMGLTVLECVYCVPL